MIPLEYDDFPEDDVPWPTDADYPGGSPRPLGDATSRLVSGGAFLLDQPAGVPARWGEGQQVVWARGESLLITGPTGVGKTTIAGQLVEALVGLGSGKVLGLRVEAARRVLYLACDRPSQAARALARLFGDQHRRVLDERLVVWKGPPPADIAQEPLTLLRLAHAAEAEVVFIDSLKDVALELSSDRVGAGVNAAFQHLLADGIDAVALHHQRKAQQGGSKPKSTNDVYGSTWIVNGAGSVVLLWGEPGDALVEFSHLKQPAELVGPWQIAHDHHTGRSSIEIGAPDALRVLLNTPGGVTAMDLARIAKRGAEPNANDRKRAERQLERLARDGLAIKRDAQRGGAGGTTPARYVGATPDSTPQPPDAHPISDAAKQPPRASKAQVRATAAATSATPAPSNCHSRPPLEGAAGVLPTNGEEESSAAASQTALALTHTDSNEIVATALLGGLHV